MSALQEFRPYLGLSKATISLFAAFSAAAGFLLTGRPPGAAFTASIAGVFLTACGAAALNHYQDRKSDSLMPRTAGRPIPAGKIDAVEALRFSLVMVSSGFAALLLTGGWIAPLLGVAAVLWYNGLYTRLKTHHAFAAIPGALVGAIPPAIGWTAGGGSISDIRLAAVCFFFFMWQVPHFFIHQQAFGGEYEAIRLPSLTAIFTAPQLNRLTLQWLLAAMASLQLLILYGLIRSPLIQISLLATSLGFAAGGFELIRRNNASHDPGLFMSTNYFMMTVLLLILADSILCGMDWTR